MKQSKQHFPSMIAKTLSLTGFMALSLIPTTPAHAAILDFQSLEVDNDPTGSIYTLRNKE